MSARKCSQCNETTNADVPFCAKCGALFPLGDEETLMRETMQNSFDLKYVLLGTLLAVALSTAALGGLWATFGARILRGEKGRSLLDVTIEAVSPTWGSNQGGTKVVVKIKPGNKGGTTAQHVTAVMMGGIKAQPFHVENLGIQRAECNKSCANQAKAQGDYDKCMLGCDPKKFKAEGEALEKCAKPCAELKTQNLPPDKLAKERTTLGCDDCEKRARDLATRESRCENECPSRKSVLESERTRCDICTKQLLPLYEARAKACEAKVTACWSWKDDLGRREVPKAPDFSKAKTPADRKQAQADFERDKKGAIADNKQRADNEKRQLQTQVHFLLPRFPGKLGTVPVKLLFANGESVEKPDTFYYAKPEQTDPPKAEKKKDRTPHDPVSTLGFWLILVSGGIAFLFVGFLLGKLAPGGGSKQPLAAGLFGWLLMQVVVIGLGASGNAMLFAMFLGVPLNIGLMLFGAFLAEKTADVA